jgi:DNA-directed RNA polymerase I, II, and III subunit RPABC2
MRQTKRDDDIKSYDGPKQDRKLKNKKPAERDDDIKSYDGPKQDRKIKNKKTAERDGKIKNKKGVKDEEQYKIPDEHEIEIFYESSYDKFIEQYKLEDLFSYKLKGELLVMRPENYITDDRISHYEYTRVISERAKQIEDGSPIFVNIREGTNPIQIAIQEVREKKCPLSVRREIGLNYVEIYKVNDMTIASGTVPE